MARGQELKARVEAIQDRHFELRKQAMDALVAPDRRPQGRQEARAQPTTSSATPRYLQRRAQFHLDFVEAENSTGFHAPQEAARILGESINFARQGQIALRDASFKPTTPVVVVSTAAPAPAPAAPASPAVPASLK